MSQHLNSLSSLLGDGNQLESGRFRPKDLTNVLTRLKELRINAETTTSKVNRQEKNVDECRTHVEASRQYIEQIEPWLNQGETYLQRRLQQTGVANLNEAKQIFDQHKVNFFRFRTLIVFIFVFFQKFLDERRQMLIVVESLLNEESTLGNQYDLKSAIKSLSTRWNDLFRKSDELSSIYDAQYRAWSLFEPELISFRDQIFLLFEQRIQSTCSIDLNKFLDPNRIAAGLNDLRVKFSR